MPTQIGTIAILKFFALKQKKIRNLFLFESKNHLYEWAFICQHHNV